MAASGNMHGVDGPRMVRGDVVPRGSGIQTGLDRQTMLSILEDSQLVQQSERRTASMVEQAYIAIHRHKNKNNYEFKGGSEMTLPLYVFLRTNVPTFFWCSVSELTA